MSLPTISIKEGDVLAFSCDVLVLKYAQGFHGVDRVVIGRLEKPPQNSATVSPKPGECALLISEGAIASKQVLFVGVPSLDNFGYPEIRRFATLSMKLLAQHVPEVETVAMTMHGAGYGLDEREAFLAQVGGLVDAFRDRAMPKYLERVVIVEHDGRRAQRLLKVLHESLPLKYIAEASATTRTISPQPLMDAGLTTKPHVFVAMPFGAEMDDVYIFGIEGPTHAAGYLCERVDMSVFTGDILARIKSSIQGASLVIADVSGANPNVYLEVGYAWGKERPTLIVVREGEELKYDISSQRCIRYKSINDLAKQLGQVLRTLVEEN
jgi:hypothetical protein